MPLCESFRMYPSFLLEYHRAGRLRPHGSEAIHLTGLSTRGSGRPAAYSQDTPLGEVARSLSPRIHRLRAPTAHRTGNSAARPCRALILTPAPGRTVASRREIGRA